MASSFLFVFLVLCLSSSALLSCFRPVDAAVDEGDKKVYIVYMGALPSKSDYSPMSHHQNILQEVIGSVGDSLVRSYGRSFNGFAATLTEAESQKLAGMEGIVSVFRDEVYQLQTTRSWDFVGLKSKVNQNPEVESNTIIGVIDSGIWPESQSFSDQGFGPAPQKWKGVCKGGLNFTCNNKVIGARYYVQDSARDAMGHGTHTASTAAGNKVDGVSYYGLGQGTARGGVPSARIAVYKVCEPPGCNAAAILAAFDDAIADGVDIITISIGGGPTPFDKDSMEIGAFHAMQRGILTAASAGNSGPGLKTAAHMSPWIFTIGASTTDRKLVTMVVTGDGIPLLGTSINDFDLEGQKYPLAYGKTASSSCTEEKARRCKSGCFDQVKGKILVCDQSTNVLEPKNAGAVGVVLHINTDNAGYSPLPLSVLADSEYNALLSYINSTPNPRGTILKSESSKDTDAPRVAAFSSRGPNRMLDDLLKPDITAPGVHILAAFSPMAPVTADPNDKRRVDYYFLSGTSMACPHAAGAAAYVKTLRPDWSPSAIKSALMTTAFPMDASKNQGAEFAYGSGHIRPAKAAAAGLVYETTKDDYLKMFCTLNLTAAAIKTISGENVNCPHQGSNLMVRDLNYPSMAAKVAASSSPQMTFSRTVTNVGTANSVYKAQVTSDPKLSVKVEPNTLSFNSLGEKKSFTVTLSGNNIGSGLVSASLVWSDGPHFVRSPIVIYF